MLKKTTLFTLLVASASMAMAQVPLPERLRHKAGIAIMPAKFSKAFGPSAFRGPFSSSTNIDVVIYGRTAQGIVPQSYGRYTVNGQGYLLSGAIFTDPQRTDTVFKQQFQYLSDSIMVLSSAQVREKGVFIPTFYRTYNRRGQLLVEYDYDSLGKISNGTRYRRDSLGSDTVIKVKYSTFQQQDSTNQRSIRFKTNGRPSRELFTTGLSVGYDYNTNGRLSRITIRTSNNQVFAYDSLTYAGDTMTLYRFEATIGGSFDTTKVSRAYPLKSSLINLIDNNDQTIDVSLYRAFPESALTYSRQELTTGFIGTYSVETSRPYFIGGTLTALVQRNYFDLTIGGNTTVFLNSYDSTVYSLAPLAVIEGLNGPKLQLLPNPGSSYLTLVGLNTPANVRILSIDGREVLATKYDGTIAIPTANLAAGVYLVEVNDGASVKRERWVKE